MLHPVYKPPALCTKAKVAKGGGGVFVGHYGIMNSHPLRRMCFEQYQPVHVQGTCFAFISFWVRPFTFIVYVCILQLTTPLPFTGLRFRRGLPVTLCLLLLLLSSRLFQLLSEVPRLLGSFDPCLFSLLFFLTL